MILTGDAARTADAMDDPRPGDRFHEHHSFWVEVVATEDGAIAVREIPPTMGMPHGYRFFRDARAFRKAYSYREGGYWVAYLDRTATPWNGSLFQLMLKAIGKEHVSPEEMNALLEG